MLKMKNTRRKKQNKTVEKRDYAIPKEEVK